MSLLEDLKEKRQGAIEMIAGVDLDMEATRNQLDAEQQIRQEWVSRIADLDRAIAALSAPEAADVEIPEGFVKWDSGYCPFNIGTHLEVFTRKNGVWPVVIKPEAPLLWEHEDHDLDIIAYRVLASEPTADFDEELLFKAGRYDAAHDTLNTDLLDEPAYRDAYNGKPAEEDA